MTILFTIVCLLISLITLIRLTIIDIKTFTLPNVYVGLYFSLGLIFHFLTQFHFETITGIFLGMVSGGGLLLTIRQIANHAYGRDTLGLGDVKLLGAAGIWLGLQDIFLAIALGAFGGLLHGIVLGLYLRHVKGQDIKITKLVIPAGPGFIFGIIIVSVYKFQTLPQFLASL